MIYHKSMVAGAIEIARADKNHLSLSCVLFDVDGTVAACNRFAIYAAQPTSEKMISSLHFPGDIRTGNQMAISIDQLSKLIKAIPMDKQFAGRLEHFSIVQDSQSANVEFNDGRAVVKHRLKLSKITASLGEYKNRLSEIASKSGLVNRLKFVYNRSRLVSVVNAIESACKYNGEFAFIDKEPYENGEIWRAINEITGQMVVCAHVLPSASSTPEKSDWEKSIFKKKITLSKRGV